MKIKEGFEGQRMIVMPEKICEELKTNEITGKLYITDTGFYPRAKFHFRERHKGSRQNILIYCTEGTGWYKVGQRQETIGEHQFLIIPSGCPHAYGASDDNPWTIYWAHFAGENAHLFTGEAVKAQSLDKRLGLRSQERNHLFEEIYHNLSTGYSQDNLEYASICLWYLLGSFKYQPQFGQNSGPVVRDNIEKGIAFMTDNIHSALTLQQIAAHCGLSVSHFSLLFKKHTSRTPIDYLLHLKMQEACRWLDFSPLKIKEVGQKIGIADAYYFSRVFKKTMGMSPKAYRNKAKG